MMPSVSSAPSIKLFTNGTELKTAVNDYITQNCTTTNKTCEVGQTYGYPMNNWRVEMVRDMSVLFFDQTQNGFYEKFNETISDWDTSRVTNMQLMFTVAKSFDSDLSKWNTSSVTDMSFMFSGATAFNSDISLWDTSKVTSMEEMFSGATSFNGNLSAWNTSNVTNMGGMFNGATSFNGNLSARNTSNVSNMFGMFADATSFNSDISSWDISSVGDMEEMFFNAASFNQDLCAWGDKFPYNSALDIFANSGCFYQDEPVGGDQSWDHFVLPANVQMYERT